MLRSQPDKTHSPAVAISSRQSSIKQMKQSFWPNSPPLPIKLPPAAGRSNSQDKTTAHQSPTWSPSSSRPLMSFSLPTTKSIYIIPSKGQGSPRLHPVSERWNNTPPSSSAFDDSDSDYEGMNETKRSFAEMVTDSSMSLPVRVMVRESIYGMSEDFTAYKNDRLDIHLMKETRYASVITSNGEKFEIPLYAPYTFTCDYSSRSLCDIEYKVSKLMKIGYLPKVGIVQNTIKQSKNKKSSHFTEGEVLILKGRIKSSTIECYSISQKETKRIHKSSGEMIILANPSQFVFDFTELIFFAFPLQVKIHPIPVRLQTVFGPTTTVVSLCMNKSLIASFSSSEKFNDKQTELFEFLPDAPFTFEMVHDLPQAQENLIKKSRMIYENFNPIQVKNVIYNDDKNCYVQGTLFKSMINPTPGGLGDDRWKSVVRLCRPNCFYPLSSDKKDQQRNSSDFFCRDDNADSLQLSSSISIPPPPTMVRTPFDVQHEPSPLASQSGITKKRSSSLFNFVDGDEGDGMVSGFVSRSVNNNTRMVTKLVDLSCDQVLLLLEKLGLSQYKEIFAKEKISGDLLKELDEEVLEHELGMKSKLHRIKLLRVIEGRVSVDSILT